MSALLTAFAITWIVIISYAIYLIKIRTSLSKRLQTCKK